MVMTSKRKPKGAGELGSWSSEFEWVLIVSFIYFDRGPSRGEKRADGPRYGSREQSPYSGVETQAAWCLLKAEYDQREDGEIQVLQANRDQVCWSFMEHIHLANIH
jgi:hypothetical protein